LSYTSRSFHTTIYDTSTPEVRIIHTPFIHKPCYKIAHAILGYVSSMSKRFWGYIRIEKEKNERGKSETRGGEKRTSVILGE
jgi:hypothetical protein